MRNGIKMISYTLIKYVLRKVEIVGQIGHCYLQREKVGFVASISMSTILGKNQNKKLKLGGTVDGIEKQLIGGGGKGMRNFLLMEKNSHHLLVLAVRII